MMWVPTQEEAIEMYARFLVAHHGRAAVRYARKAAGRLCTEGDSAGHAIWNRVADEIERGPLKRSKAESVQA
jgi:hypothetical protein